MEKVKKAAEVIKAGGLVLYPTDTVYILAVDATNQKAVNKLLEFKNRWTGKAISVAVTDELMASEYVELDDNARQIYKNLLPGPFTIVSRGKHRVAQGIEAESGTLGIRIPDNDYVKELVKLVGKPVTATSANLAGRAPHYSVDSLIRTLSKRKKEMLDYVADVGKLPRNKPSTVIDITEREIKVLRRGDLVTGEKRQTFVTKSEAETRKIGEFMAKKCGAKEKAIVFGLTGDLGCGKTVFSRGVAKALGIEEKITSPTFVIYNEYATDSGKFLHFDLYRLTDEYEFEEIKFLTQFEKGVVACIEWPEMMGEKIFKQLKEKVNYIAVEFRYLEEQVREIKY